MATSFAPVQTAVWAFRDSKGQTARVKGYINTSSAFPDAAALVTAMTAALQGLSNAVLYAVYAIDGNAGAFVQYGASAVYENVEDKAKFVFQDVVGRLMRFEVPAPKTAIFLSDGETVNPANGLAAAFITAVTTSSGTANMVNKSAGVVNDYVGGLRIRRKYQRRGNIFTLTPQLTAGIPEE
jgi:hypothetical protein